MNHAGMRYSLASRDIIADSIETVMNAQSYAGNRHGVRVHRTTGRKEGGRGETLFGMILALAAMYGIGSVVAFLAGYLVR